MTASLKLFFTAVLWGIALWFIGYVLGIIFFMFVPQPLIGWFVMPIGIAVTLWVLMKKISRDTFRRYVAVGVSWMLIAVILDYLFIVKLMKPADGYYKTDVYLYYFFTLMLPIYAGLRKKRPVHANQEGI